MMRDIEAETAFTRHLTGKKSLAPRVLEAVREVPRECFIPTESAAYAFDNGPLPIGHGQTISQPFIVALMTDLLNPKPGDVILEIGAGSGYQAAILSRLVKQVYSIEIIPELGGLAADRLKKLGYLNVEVIVGDGYFGWPEQAPYDGIIVTAAAPYFPEPLIDQLKAGGRMVIPIGLPYRHQELMTVDKDAQGEIEACSILPVAFVPLTGEGGGAP